MLKLVQLKQFVIKYSFYLLFLTAMQMLEISLLIFGSLEPTYFDMDEEDGYKRLRYVWFKEV
jgi:hypothetical protein